MSVSISVRVSNMWPLSTSALLNVNRLWRDSEVVLRHSVSVPTNKIASWDIDWSSDDVTSSWGWRQEDMTPRWDRALPALQSSLRDLFSDSTNQSPNYWWSFYTHCVSTFITSFSIIIPKPNSKLPFFKWLSPVLINASFIFSAKNWWSRTPTTTLFLSIRAWTLLSFSGFVRRKSFLVAIPAAVCDRHGPHWTSLCCVKMSALNLNLPVR